MIEIVHAQSQQQIEVVRDLFIEFLEWSFSLTATLPPESVPTFATYKEELANLPYFYEPPRGRLLLALADGQPAGTIALKPIDLTTAEVKRTYVRPEYRGHGIGSRLVARLIEEARQIGYTRLVLDSHMDMKAAHAVYQGMGFRFTSPREGFPEHLILIVIFMELDLKD